MSTRPMPFSMVLVLCTLAFVSGACFGIAAGRHQAVLDANGNPAVVERGR